MGSRTAGLLWRVVMLAAFGIVASSCSLWVWGAGPPQSDTPLVVSSTGTNWADVSAGGRTRCAVALDRTLWCWGDNDHGQVGDGTTTDVSAPTQIGTATNWASVYVGGAHTCGRRIDSTLWCWGSNFNGQLGDGTTTDSLTPQQVGTDTDWRQVDTKSQRFFQPPLFNDGIGGTCAVKTDGSLWCWGSNVIGQLGLGATIQVTVPTRVGTASDWTAVAVSTTHSCGLRGSGDLWCWGDNTHGQLGTAGGSTTVPAPVSSGWRQVDTGGGVTLANPPDPGGHTCAIDQSDALWCWGFNVYGQLGNGTTSDAATPTRIGTARDWRQVSTGRSHSCAVATDSTMWCWGTNSGGELGDGTRTPRLTPTQVGVGTDWFEVDAGAQLTIATDNDF
ncbi:MAG: hypothetical protein HKN26_02545 [Acidimicrobiales bacterium]|nr:hypothetical protein [Acidimicrobiales bacterium]